MDKITTSLLLEVGGGEDVALVPGGRVLEYLGLRLSHIGDFVCETKQFLARDVGELGTYILAFFCVSHQTLPQVFILLFDSRRHLKGTALSLKFPLVTPPPPQMPLFLHR